MKLIITIACLLVGISFAAEKTSKVSANTDKNSVNKPISLVSINSTKVNEASGLNTILRDFDIQRTPKAIPTLASYKK